MDRHQAGALIAELDQILTLMARAETGDEQAAAELHVLYAAEQALNRERTRLAALRGLDRPDPLLLQPVPLPRDCANPGCDRTPPNGDAYCDWRCRNEDDRHDD